MDDGFFEILLYIIVMVVAGAGSILKAVFEKKKKESTPPPVYHSSEEQIDEPEEISMVKSFEDIYREFTGYVEPEEEVLETQPDTAPVFHTSSQQIEPDYFSKRQSMLQKKDFSKERTNRIVPLLVEEETITTDSDNRNIFSTEQFDLRQAVIYSEILNRKYD